MNKHQFIVSEKELFTEEPKQIVAFMDGLTPDEVKSANNFISSLIRENKINDLGFRKIIKDKELTLGHALHECLLKYPCSEFNLSLDSQMENGAKVEFIRLLTSTEVWVFDKGDNYPYNGRLANQIKNMELPVRFLCRTKNNNWAFYRGLDLVFDEDAEEIVENWFLIGETGPYIPEVKNKLDKNVFYRPFSKESMNEREYSIAERALFINAKTSSLLITAMVRQDNYLDERSKILMSKGNTIFIKMQKEENLTEETLQFYETQLDFIEAEIEDLILDYCN